MIPRRLLVISYHFPPDGAVGGLRWAGISKYLARLGWDIHVVTAAEQGSRIQVPGVNVSYVARRRTLDDHYNAAAHWLRSRRQVAMKTEPQSEEKTDAAKPDATQARARHSRHNALANIRASLSALLGFPDHGRGWMLRAAARCDHLLQQHAFDAVISSGPPHSSHLSAKLACRGRSTPRIVDMRDPWADLRYAEAQTQRRSGHAFEPLVPHLENHVVQGAQLVICNNAHFAEFFSRQHRDACVVTVPNGVDLEELPSASNEKFPGVALVYAGILYLERNLTTVVNAMSTVLKQRPEARSRLTLRVAGAMDGPQGNRFLREVQSAGVQDCVQVLGPVSSKAALALVNRSHLALVLAQHQRMQVPAKLYQCAGMGIPTLIITEADSAAASEARRIGAMVCEPNAEADIVTLINRLLAGDVLGTSSRAAVTYESTASHVEKLILAHGSHI